MNLVSGDVQRLDDVALNLMISSYSFLEIAAVAGLTWYFLGCQPLAGILFMLILSLYYVFLGIMFLKLRYRIAKVTDKRLDLINSIITAIRSVKMNTWECPVGETLQQIRRCVRLVCIYV